MPLPRPTLCLSWLIVLVVAVTAAVGRALNKTSGWQWAVQGRRSCRGGGQRGANNNAKSASNQINSNVTKNIHILSTFVGRSLATANSPATPKWLGPPQSHRALPCHAPFPTSAHLLFLRRPLRCAITSILGRFASRHKFCGLCE